MCPDKFLPTDARARRIRAQIFPRQGRKQFHSGAARLAREFFRIAKDHLRLAPPLSMSAIKPGQFRQVKTALDQPSRRSATRETSENQNAHPTGSRRTLQVHLLPRPKWATRADPESLHRLSPLPFPVRPPLTRLLRSRNPQLLPPEFRDPQARQSRSAGPLRYETSTTALAHFRH